MPVQNILLKDLPILLFFDQALFIEQIPTISRNRQHCFYQDRLWGIIFYIDGHSNDRAIAVVFLILS